MVEVDPGAASSGHRQGSSSSLTSTSGSFRAGGDSGLRTQEIPSGSGDTVPSVPRPSTQAEPDRVPRRFDKVRPGELPNDKLPPGARWIPGPEVAVISYIDDQEVSEEDVTRAYARWKEANPRGGDPTVWDAVRHRPYQSETEVKARLRRLMEEIYAGHNEVPPDRLRDRVLDKLILSGDCKGWISVTPAIYCMEESGKLVIGAHPRIEVRSFAGETVVPGIGNLGGRDNTTIELLSDGPSCRTWRIYHETKFSAAVELATRAAFGVGAPLVWEEILYTLCCDGTYGVQIYGSHFPCHKAYSRTFEIGQSQQEDLPDFLWLPKGAERSRGVLIAEEEGDYWE